jgi:hypothetical protein
MKSHGKRTLYWFALGSVAFFVMSFSSPECSKTATEPVVEPGLEQTWGGSCEFGCWIQYLIGRIYEYKRWRAAKEACNGDPDCLVWEQAVHDEIVQELRDDRDACLDACAHEQGGAVSGQ